MLEEVVPWLVCPQCRDELKWNMHRRDGDRIVEADARCPGCGDTFEVRDGIAALLAARPDPAADLWEEAEGHLSAHLRGDATLSARLMDGPLDQLNPADRFLRAMVLEDRGRLGEAQAAVESAWPGLYTAAMRESAAAMIDEVVSRVPGEAGRGPVVDLACGRGMLLTRIAQAGHAVVGTDVSVRVLRGVLRRLRHRGLAGRVSLVAADLRHVPLRDAGAGLLTTHLGLDNLSPAHALDGVLAECRRVAGGTFLSICQAEQTGTGLRWPPHAGEVSPRHPLLARMDRRGWRSTVLACSDADAEPTPQSQVLEGVRIDAFPPVPTIVHWSLIAAH